MQSRAGGREPAQRFGDVKLPCIASQRQPAVVPPAFDHMVSVQSRLSHKMMKIAVGSESVRSVTHTAVSPEMSVHRRTGQENQRLEQTLFRDVPLNLELRRTSSEAQVQRSSAKDCLRGSFY